MMNLSSKDARTIALECGVQNFAFTMVMITLSFGTGDNADNAMLFPVMYGVACEFFCSVINVMMTFLQQISCKGLLFCLLCCFLDIINSSWLVAFFRFYLARWDEHNVDENEISLGSSDLFEEISMGKYPREGSNAANKLLAACGIQLIASNITKEELNSIKGFSA